MANEAKPRELWVLESRPSMQLPRSIHATKRAAEECAYPDEEPVRYIPASPTKPEVVDGEVTRAHRELAVRVMFPQAGPESWLWKWVESGDDDEPGDKFPTARIAQAICDGESRGFAAGRASVTAKAEGWVQMASSDPDKAGWYGLCWVQFDDGSVDEKRPHYHTGNGAWRVVTSDHVQHAKVVAWCRATAPLPPAPSDAEPAKDPR
jgi:hypothetical protein